VLFDRVKLEAFFSRATDLKCRNWLITAAQLPPLQIVFRKLKKFRQMFMNDWNFIKFCDKFLSALYRKGLLALYACESHVQTLQLCHMPPPRPPPLPYAYNCPEIWDFLILVKITYFCNHVGLLLQDIIKYLLLSWHWWTCTITNKAFTYLSAERMQCRAALECWRSVTTCFYCKLSNNAHSLKHGLHYQSFCDHSTNFASVNYKF
jgi:hypothetical protein